MIEINNLTRKKIDGKFLAEIAKKVLKEEKNNSYISIVLVGSQKIKDLNKKYRNLNEATSVLTFFQGQAYPEKVFLLGDIVICPEVAEKKNLTIKFLIGHGIRNLLSEIPTAKSLRT